MTNRLIMGMYGGEFSKSPDTSRLFDLRTGQMRDSYSENRRIVKNAGWYNANGHKLGWGDISPRDIQAIARDIQEDEIFVVLSEQDSFWNFVDIKDQPIALIGSLAVVDSLDEHLPSRAYVAERAVMAMRPGELISTGQYGTVDGYEKLYPQYVDDLTFTQHTALELYLLMEGLAKDPS